MPMEKAIM